MKMFACQSVYIIDLFSPLLVRPLVRVVRMNNHLVIVRVYRIVRVSKEHLYCSETKAIFERLT